MTVPQRLRQALEHQRDDLGRPFRIAWPIALSEALRGLPAADALFWRPVLNLEQRAHWERQYDRLDHGPALFVPGYEVDGHRRTHELVA